MNLVREFQLLEKIGEGGMGLVYKAHDTNLDRFVAIKAIHTTFTSNEEIVARFRQEARLQASLAHPNIVSTYNFFQEAGIFYMVMEYVEGETLSKRIKRVGLIPPHKCLPLMFQILEGMQFAHEKGIVHRDLKPSNIIITPNEKVKIMDFGIAKILGDKSMTRTGTKMGTVYYMSPEQVEASKDVDVRSDVFSLGVVFFEMLTGQLPYNLDTDSDFKLMQQIVSITIPSVKKYYPYVPDKIDAAVQRATNKERSLRFQTCKEFYDSIKDETIEEQSNISRHSITLPPLANTAYVNSQFDELFGHDTPSTSKSSGNSVQNNPSYKYPTGNPSSVYSNQGSSNTLNVHYYPKGDVGKRLGASILDTIIGYFTIGILWVIKDGLSKGKGLAKSWLGLRIIDLNTGTVISFGKGVGRFLLHLGMILFLSLISSGVLGVIYGIADCIIVLASTDGRRIVDRMLSTQVVNESDIVVDLYGYVQPAPHVIEWQKYNIR